MNWKREGSGHTQSCFLLLQSGSRLPIVYFPVPLTIARFCLHGPTSVFLFLPFQSGLMAWKPHVLEIRHIRVEYEHVSALSLLQIKRQSSVTQCHNSLSSQLGRSSDSQLSSGAKNYIEVAVCIYVRVSHLLWVGMSCPQRQWAPFDNLNLDPVISSNT